MKEYDETDPISIETYAKKLIGKTFADVCREDDITKSTVVREASNYEVKHANKKRKGGLGELIEERFFIIRRITMQDQILIRQVWNLR